VGTPLCSCYFCENSGLGSVIHTYYEVCANLYALYLRITQRHRSEKSRNSSNAEYLFKIGQGVISTSFCRGMISFFFSFSPCTVPYILYFSQFTFSREILQGYVFCREASFLFASNSGDLCLSSWTNNETQGLIEAALRSDNFNAHQRLS